MVLAIRTNVHEHEPQTSTGSRILKLKNSCFDVLYSGLPMWTWWGKNVPKGKHSIAFCLPWFTNVCAKFPHLNNATSLN